MTFIAKHLVWTFSFALLALPARASGPTIQEIALGIEPVPEALNELRHSVALLPGGGYAVVWDESTPPGRAIRLQYVRPNGTLVFPDGGRIVASSERVNYSSVVVAHPSDGVFVAFLQTELGVYANRARVQWIDAKGRSRWRGEGVPNSRNLYPGFIYSHPQLAADDEGGAWVCYMFDLHGKVDATIGCYHVRAQGRTVWSTYTVGGNPGWRTVPRVVTDGAGGLLVFWRNQRLLWEDDEYNFMLIEGQRYDQYHTRLWGEKGRVLHTLHLKELNHYGQSDLDAVPDGRGGAILAFPDSSGSGTPSLDVFAIRVTRGGRLVWGDGVAVATGPTTQQLGGLVPDLDGGAFVAVTEYFHDDRPSRMLLSRVGRRGSRAWGKQGVLLSDPRSEGNAWGAYGSFDGGLLRIAWNQQLKRFTFSTDVQLAVFDPSGQRLATESGIPLTTAPDSQYLRGFVFDPGRQQGFALFEDRRTGDSFSMDVYGALYREP